MIKSEDNMSNIFIRCPWSDMPTNENFLTDAQAKKMFLMIVNAIEYKYYYYELKKQNRYAEALAYDLQRIGVFNKFANAVSTTIVDPEARYFVLECIRKIRDCNVKKRNVKATIDTLYNILARDKVRRSLYAEFTSTQDGKFINFLYILDNCKNRRFDNDSDEIRQLVREFNAYKNKQLDKIDV